MSERHLIFEKGKRPYSGGVLLGGHGDGGRGPAAFLPRWWWLLPALALGAWALWGLAGCSREGRDKAGADGVAMKEEKAAKRPARIGLEVTFPTAQTNLLSTDDETVYMPTASGRVESALYGSTRTSNHGGRINPSFHEGIDIGPMARDSRGRPLDDILAIADGQVAYANRNAGGSSYGIYVVLIHDDDEMGPVYSLYSHLASVSAGVREGVKVERGAVIGIMGNTSSIPMPMARAHLHLEVGLMLNRRFADWCRRHKMDPTHGIHHGWNLTGVDPLAMYPEHKPVQNFRILEHLKSLPSAFDLILRVNRRPDYFRMYPPLWRHGNPGADVIVLSVCHGGVITAGREANEDERKRLGNRRNLVLTVDREVLGRNGQGLISQRRGAWSLTGKGDRWVDMLTY